jgi:hypothetical protein
MFPVELPFFESLIPRGELAVFLQVMFTALSTPCSWRSKRATRF